MLFEKHSSMPYNPKIADTFFKTGMIESWGRGFDKIKNASKESKDYNLRKTEY
jgi:ATP-dependent DNA helicase RecG